MHEAHGHTALTAAITGGHVDIAELLIKAGAAVNARSTEISPLHLAAQHGQTELVKLMPDATAEVDEPVSVLKTTALMDAPDTTMPPSSPCCSSPGPESRQRILKG